MQSKFRMRLGEFEVEFEGDAEFIKKDLPETISSVAKLGQDISTAVSKSTLLDKSTRASATSADEQDLSGMTINSIAAKLKPNSGSQLIITACAKFIFIDKKPDCSRQEILDEIKLATGYYMKSYCDNLTNYLGRLVKSKELVEVAKDKYTLSQAEKERILIILKQEA